MHPGKCILLSSRPLCHSIGKPSGATSDTIATINRGHETIPQTKTESKPLQIPPRIQIPKFHREKTKKQNKNTATQPAERLALRASFCVTKPPQVGHTDGGRFGSFRSESLLFFYQPGVPVRISGSSGLGLVLGLFLLGLVSFVGELG